MKVLVTLVKAAFSIALVILFVGFGVWWIYDVRQTLIAKRLAEPTMFTASSVTGVKLDEQTALISGLNFHGVKPVTATERLRVADGAGRLGKTSAV
jgi:hypothetical protein